jgi:prepilin-type N-terminal cleavage/methylation domain-containing protein
VKGIASNAWVAHASRVWAMASSPSRTFLGATFVRRDIVLQDRFGETPKPARETRALPRPVESRAFTVVELLIVMAIILILAGLILATSSYVQKKGARSRAEAEIAAMSAALENYKADNGIYPRSTASDDLDARTVSDPNSYRSASGEFYAQIIGDADYDDVSDTGAKAYMTFKPNMKSVPDPTKPAGSGNKTFARDPFGNSYGYSTAGAKYAETIPPPATPRGYNPTFDLWSTATETDSSRWIKNW